MIETAFAGLLHGFGVALLPHNLGWCFLGVLIGNVMGVLPGMGVMAAISMLLPLTFAMEPVSSILMLAGIYYGAQYGGAICSILLNLPSHPPHAVTCLDGFPLTQQGKAGTALGVTMLASFVGASFGITLMIFFAPVLVGLAFRFGAEEIFAIMLLGLLAGSTLARGSPLKGVAMTLVGILLGLIGTDPNTAAERFTFGERRLDNGIELVAVALGFFGIAEFVFTINRLKPADLRYTKIRMRDMMPARADLRRAALPTIRGTVIGSLCSLIPGTGPTIASFIAYAAEKKVGGRRKRFGTGMIEGVAAPEAATHSSVQGDFIPTMSLGIPGDAVMALLLGALLIHGIIPGPALVTQHPDIFWGLIASFWVGNILLVILNVPLIGIWVRLLSVPYRFLLPAAILFICVGVYAANNSHFEVLEALAIGLFGCVMIYFDFHPAPVLLGFVLGPKLEENFRRAMTLSNGDIGTFVDHPISAAFLALGACIVVFQIIHWYLGRNRPGADPGVLPFDALAPKEALAQLSPDET